MSKTRTLIVRRVIATIVLVAAAIGFTSMDAAEAKSKPKVVQVVPSSCTLALDTADQIIAVNKDVFTAMQQFFQSLSAAAGTAQSNPTLSGLTVFVQSITAASSTLTSAANNANTRLTPLVPIYTSNRDACKAAAGK